MVMLGELYSAFHICLTNFRYNFTKFSAKFWAITHLYTKLSLYDMGSEVFKQCEAYPKLKNVSDSILRLRAGRQSVLVCTGNG